MLAQRPPMGWNSWNTFGSNISEELIFSMADAMVADGYLAAGYEYLVIDDCWSLMERSADGHLVPDPAKFPHGMKAVADYVHSKGLKFGMYSCAGVRTCAGYPGSYDHEFTDAADFAAWGVDFLKYDFCNFPSSAHCKNRYLRMSMALKASGREILFSACNWGVEEPWQWMGSVGAHMYRSTGDINDSYKSFRDIAVSQMDKLSMSGPGCFNDPDMLVVGMYGQGNVGFGGCSDLEYQTHFALWCLFGVPLMMGADLRGLNDVSRKLLLNPQLLEINQDPGCRAPYLADSRDGRYFFVRHLEDGTFVLAYFNLTDDQNATYRISCSFDDIGLPYGCGWGLDLTDVFTGESLGVKRDYFFPEVPAHGCKMYRARLVRLS